MGKKFEKNKHFKVFQCVGILDSCWDSGRTGWTQSLDPQE